MTKIINFYGGPSAGKSTYGGQLFGYMKAHRMNVEYVPEFAKQLTWRKAHSCLDDQYYIFGVQHHELYTLKDQVEYVVTDSPIMISTHYYDIAMNKYKNKELSKALFVQLVLDAYHQFDNINFLVERGDRKFIQAGRNQNEDESKTIDGDMHTMLVKHRLPFKRVTSFDDVLHNMQMEFVS